MTNRPSRAAQSVGRTPTGRGFGKRRAVRRRSPLVAFFKLIVVVVALALFFWWQQNGIVTKEILVSGAPAGFDGYRIVLISDVHAKEFGEGNKILLEKTAALRPDMIAVVGDLYHEAEQITMIPALATGLAQIAPTYYVTGNHEWAVGDVPKLKELLTQCGVTVLSNETTTLERNGDFLVLMGADDLNGRADQKTIGQMAGQVRQEKGENAYLLLLSHRNNRYQEYQNARIDLTLAGHAHGGLIRLPGTDGLIGPHREWFPEYTAGRYDLAYGQMVVSRGLGNQLPAFRLFNRPDLPVVVLKGS